jgi:hypothetical protein
MRGRKETDWTAWIARELEALRLALHRRPQFSDQLATWFVRRIVAAKRNPSHPRSRLWLRVRHLTPKEFVELVMDLPGLEIPKPKGRRKGSAAVHTPKMIKQLNDRIKRTGERPYTAARHVVVKEYGSREYVIENLVRNLVRVWKKSDIK